MPGAFKLDHLQAFEPILFQKILNFFTFILGGQFLLPQRLIIGKGIYQTSKLNDTEEIRCLGHSNWTICSPLSPFCPKRFSAFSLSYWEANSYYPRGPILGKGKSPNSKIVWYRGFQVPGAFKLDHLRPIRPLLFPNFLQLFHFHAGRPILITPEG